MFNSRSYEEVDSINKLFNINEESSLIEHEELLKIGQLVSSLNTLFNSRNETFVIPFCWFHHPMIPTYLIGFRKSLEKRELDESTMNDLLFDDYIRNISLIKSEENWELCNPKFCFYEE